MGAVQGLLRLDEYRERKNPHNKIRYVGTHLLTDLDAAVIPVAAQGNRHQRRALKGHAPAPQRLSANQVMVGVSRTLNKIQVSVSIRNDAVFPISVFLESADTEVEGQKPPRGVFPKNKALVATGNTVLMSDDAIEMDGSPCQRMAGKMYLKIKYGLQGKERFTLELKADLDIQMEPWGAILAVGSTWTP